VVQSFRLNLNWNRPKGLRVKKKKMKKRRRRKRKKKAVTM
jgi:hypothetical protein